MSDLTTQITITESGLLTSQPQNANFLSPLGFRFSLKRSPNLNFFATDANIPSFDIGYVEMPSPFKIIELPGDKPKFGDFNITFKVDEGLQNYLEIFNWIAKIGYPENFEQFASVRNTATGSGQGTVSDGTLTILNSAMDPTTEIRFENMFPYSLSEVNFTTADSTVNYVTARAAFKFNMMKIVAL
ncbi:tail completion and sheath stabilizer protein [uncultured Caudovirales phage]|uniref:Tail completion and sheath stabilizer protein n=1 Tax=uncultured Caudovirales phage TaxID=2100421 RepID=A0A6J7WTU8_9CAUD|nr:tail completion and sheath stabilizer protein [uncultured Caudovirales phage]